MTHINGVNNANLTPMQRLMQQTAVTKAMDVPIGQTKAASTTPVKYDKIPTFTTENIADAVDFIADMMDGHVFSLNGKW